jgi:hypothetical protein
MEESAYEPALSGAEFHKCFFSQQPDLPYKKIIKYTFFFLLIIFNSCITLSPISSSEGLPVSFSHIENIEPQWLHFADGIGYFHGRVVSPGIEFWALRIDLFAENIKIVVRDGAVNTENNNSLSTKVSSFVRDNNLVAGINAVPFDVATSIEGQVIRNVGIVISDGALLSPVNRRYDALVFYKDKKAAIVNQSSITSTENIENAVGGFHQILKSGQPANRTFNNDTRHPRSSAGISYDGRFLYLLVIDGRRAGSVGGTEFETAALLHLLGSWDGINFDGGGSSALAMRFHDGSVETVNTPVHRFPGQERAVAGCLGVKLIELNN